MPMQGLTRAAVLRRGAGGGLAAAVAATPLALLPGVARATPPDGDLAYLRLLLAGELLAVAFWVRALAQLRLDARTRSAVKHLIEDEQQHRDRLTELLDDAGQVPATSADFDFSFPAKTFTSVGAILHEATKIEGILVGAYIGALVSVTTPDIRLALAQIAANEAQHASTVARFRGGPMIGPAFGPALSIDAASSALGRYES